MYARAVTIQLHPDKIEEAGQIMREVAATLRGYAGFHEATLLADRGTGQGQIVTLWASEADIAASDTTIYREAMARLAATFAAPPQRATLEVIVHEHQGRD